MATGLKRDPILILRIDGQDLLDFVQSPRFEPEMVSIFSEINLPGGSLRDYIIKMFGKLSVEQGMPPSSDSWVMSNIVEPSLQSLDNSDHKLPLSQEMVLVEFRKVAESVAQHLKEQPVIVAHTENTFDGSSIKMLLSTEIELDKSLDAAIELLPKNHNGKMSKEYLPAALESIAVSTSLPHFGTISQMDKVVEDAFKEITADDGQLVKVDGFKKMMTELLGSIMLQLEGSPISVSSSSVVKEPLVSSSTILTETSAEHDPGDSEDK